MYTPIEIRTASLPHSASLFRVLGADGGRSPFTRRLAGIARDNRAPAAFSRHSCHGRDLFLEYQTHILSFFRSRTRRSWVNKEASQHFGSFADQILLFRANLLVSGRCRHVDNSRQHDWPSERLAHGFAARAARPHLGAGLDLRRRH
jgi:hypothetical protein